ncbi:protoporphyrinogen oxidase [Planctomonas psychrotolerans]|uniref:protoporphyrinogen oxidase n=1 Tax=Planctomonas psychrotolerans TaxID=2528712 RepID=UPI0029D4147C|nr:protoporphyrinogen oxidase [Planctomonas psychrotolerans]
MTRRGGADGGMDGGSDGAASPLDVVVVGGGVAGLVVARELALGGATVRVIEASDALGGSVATHTVAGIRLDSGAESFATRRGTVAALLDELGLGDDVVAPSPLGAWLQAPDRAFPLPRTALLGIPSDPRDPELRELLGRRGAARAALDLVLPAAVGASASSLGDLVRLRMGSAVLDRLVAPIVAGVHSASPDDVDADAVAPGLRAGLKTEGSLAASVARLRERAPAGSAVGGIRGGMHRLVEELERDLRERGVAIETGTRVSALRRHRDRDGAVTGDDWHIDLADGRALDPDRVVLAIPPEASAPLFGGMLPQSLSEAWPMSTPVELMTLVIDVRADADAQDALDRAPRGTGVLVTEGMGGVRAKALTHVTAKWPWVADRADGRHVVRLSYGRANERGVADVPDADLLSTAIADASLLLGVPLRADQVVGSARTRWSTAVPFAARGQKDRVALVRAEVAENPGIDVTGAWIAGTGLASVIVDARETAVRIGGSRTDRPRSVYAEKDPSPRSSEKP